MKSIPNYLICLLLLLCGLVSIAEVSVNLDGGELSDRAVVLYFVIFAFVTATWVLHDSRQSNFSAPFDFGLFIYLFLPILLPYYLFKTRRVDGLMMFFGFVAIYILPSFAGLYAYVYYS